MKIHYFLSKVLCMLVCINVTAWSQTGEMYMEIQHAKRMEPAIESVQLFEPLTTTMAKTISGVDILDGFINPDEVGLFQLSPFQKSFASLPGSIMRMSIPYRGSALELELLEVPDDFYDYEIVTATGERYPANREIKHYRGVVKDNPTSVVGISIYNNEIMGLVATEEGNFTLAPVEERSSTYIFYNDRNMKNKMEFECDFEREYYKSEESGDYPSIQPTGSLPVVASKYARISVDIAHDIYLRKGSVANVEAFIMPIYNYCTTLYRNDGIMVGVSELYIWNVPDPFGADGLTTSQLLANYIDNFRRTMNGDIAQMVTFRQGEGIGVARWTPTCNFTNKSMTRLLDAPIVSYPTYTQNVMGATHELGHNLGSEHTHQCVWNGNNTAIDGCVTPQGCPDPGKPLIGGTIMSYCHKPGNPGIYFAFGFGSQPSAKIKQTMQAATCLREMSIRGSDFVACGSTATYTLYPTPPGSFLNISWLVSGALATVGTPTFSSITVRPYTPTAGGATGHINYGQLISHRVSVGAMRVVSISGPREGQLGGYSFTAQVTDQSLAQRGQYEWNVTPASGVQQITNPTDFSTYIYFREPGYYDVWCRAISPCTGPDVYAMTYIVISNGYRISSDGKSNIYRVSREYESEKGGDKTISYSLIHATAGTPVREGVLSEDGGTLNFNNEKSGVYLLRLHAEGKELHTQKIILK